MVAHTDLFEPRTSDDYPSPIQPVFETAPAHLRKTHPELWARQVDVTALENDLGHGVGLTVDDLDIDLAEYFDSVTGVSETSDERSLAEGEVFMLLRPALDPLAALFPPKPLTVQELRSWLDTAYPHPYDEYTAFVRNGPDTADGTLVGSYRDRRDAPVIRFQIQHGRQFMVDFMLVPVSRSPWFAWAAQAPMDPQSPLIDRSHDKHPLEELCTHPNPDAFLAELPNRRRQAQRLLGSSLTPSSPSPTPDNWTTTQCQHAGDAAKLFQPRYEATFVHKPSNIVLRLTPGDADPDDINFEENAYGVDISNDETTKQPHEWSLDGAPAALTTQITDMYDNPLAGRLFFSLMEVIDAMTG